MLDTCRHLAGEGFEITFLRPNCDGIVTPLAVRDSLRDDTILVSLMQVNNETGTITDIESIGDIASERGVTFHVDAVQSMARVQLDITKTNADFISLSAHKMYGPKGVGALLRTWQIGAGHRAADSRRRPGTRSEGRHSGDAPDRGYGQSC